MDRQRLQKLAGVITEAKYASAGSDGSVWVALERYTDSADMAAYGPFSSKAAAEEFSQSRMKSSRLTGWKQKTIRMQVLPVKTPG